MDTTGNLAHCCPCLPIVFLFFQMFLSFISSFFLLSYPASRSPLPPPVPFLPPRGQSERLAARPQSVSSEVTGGRDRSLGVVTGHAVTANSRRSRPVSERPRVLICRRSDANNARTDASRARGSADKKSSPATASCGHHHFRHGTTAL